MTKETEDNEEQNDKSIWQQVMDTVRPLTPNNILNKFKASVKKYRF